MAIPNEARGGSPVVARLFCTGLLLAAFPASALADWTVIPLHPAGAYMTSIGGVTAAQQVGQWQATSQSITKPVIWSGSAGSMISLAQAPSDRGYLSGLSGDTQFGQLNGQASLWHGTPSSRVSLHPPGAPLDSGTTVFGMSGNEQVGQYALPGVGHAAVWHGTAASFVDLHPAGAFESVASGTDGTHQGGFVQGEFTGSHAALWSGSAASMVDLNPPGADGSEIHGMVPGQQVGFAIFGSPSVDHAVMWSGTAASWIDLNPANGSSILYATCGSAQVGTLNGLDAAIWFGTPQSVVNLHSLLPSSYYFSIATSVYESNGLFYVGGWAARSGGPSEEAFLWVGVPAPSGAPALVFASIVARGRRRSAYGLHTQV
jgi:hypothetical protein